MNAAFESYVPTPSSSKSVRPAARLSSSASRRSPRARTGKYATQLEALANAHTQVTK